MYIRFIPVAFALAALSCRENSPEQITSGDAQTIKIIPSDRESLPSRTKKLSDIEHLKFVKNQILNRSINHHTKYHVFELAENNPGMCKTLLLDALTSSQSEYFKLMICDVVAILLESDGYKSTLDWILCNPVLLDGDNWHGIAVEIAKSDPKLGLDVALKLPSSKLRNELLISCSRVIATIDRSAIEHLLAKVDDLNEKNSVLSAVANEYLKADNLDLAIFFYKKMPPASLARQSGIAWSFASLLEKNPSEVKRLFKDQIQTDQIAILSNTKVKTEIFQKFTPQDVLGIINALPLTTESMLIQQKYIKNLSDNNPELASTWLEGLPPSKQSLKLYELVYQNIANNNFELAQKLLANISNEDSKNAVVKGMLNAVSTRNLDQAFTLALNDNLDESLQSDYYKRIARDNAVGNPSQAIKILERSDFHQFIDVDFRQDMINHIVQNWAKQDHEAAQQWVEKLPASDQPKGVQGLVAQWMKTDPIAASEWLSQQPAGPARDAGAQEIINQIKDTDPEMAEQWRKSMTPK